MKIMIKVPRQKVDEMYEHIEESLRHLGKAMQCVDTVKESEEYNEEEYDEMMAMREHERRYMPEDRYREDMGMRRGRASNGRYARM